MRRSDDPEPTTATLVHEGGWSDMTVAIAPADASDFVVVHVTDPEGRGVPGVRFTSEAASSSRRFRPGLMQPRTRPDGEYWIPWNSLTGGEATAPTSTVLVATSPDFGSIRAEITGPEARVSMQFMEAAECEVRVHGEIDGPYEVSLEPADSAVDPLLRILSRSSLVAAVPDDGVVTLGPVQPGDYILSIREKSSTGRPRATDSVSKAVAISSGLTRLSIEVPSAHELLVTVASDGARPTRGLSATRESVRGPARGRHAPESYDGATARFEGLLPGEYRLSRIGNEGVLEEMIVEVPCAPVTFTPMRATGLIVTRGSKDGPLGPAELVPGDVVTGFDGVSAAERRFFQSLEEALKERDVTLRYERGGVQRTAVLARDPDVTQGALQVTVRFKTRLE